MGIQLPREEDVIREEPDLLQLKTPEAVEAAPPEELCVPFHSFHLLLSIVFVISFCIIYFM
jgi:hypothetical protein